MRQCSLSLLLSLWIVPFFISALGAVSEGGATVSSSPVIYAGAVVFPLFAAMLGASKPARKAAGISPIEVQKYTGIAGTAKNARSLAHGKPYRMALRNIFRDRKRAAVVLLSLFLGVTTFLSVTTLVLSTDIAEYVDSTFESDFVLENSVWPAQKFDDAFLEQIASIPGAEGLYSTSVEKIAMDYSEAFREYLSNHSMQDQIAGLPEQDIAESFKGFLIGADGEALTGHHDAAGSPIDLAAFERGEIALIATDHPELFSDIHEVTISLPDKANGNSGPLKRKVALGGFVPFDYKGIGSGLSPTVVMSNSCLREWLGKPAVARLDLNVSEGHEQNASIALKQIIGNDDQISLASRSGSMEELNQAKMAILALGGSISLIIALIGVLNFVNTMSVSIMARRRELATLESIGMSSRQIRKMLIDEGLCYAAITLTLVLSIGNSIAYGIFNLFRQQVSFVAFTYPLAPTAAIISAILAVCLMTPERMYHSLRRETIVARLREAE